MRVIGLLGGMSWESSVHYYRLVNEGVKNSLGGFHSAECLLYSVDFSQVAELQEKGEWGELTEMMIDAAQSLKKGGAHCLLICANTMHMMADEVEAAVNLPLIHIGDATGVAVERAGLKRVGLLGTRYTMEEDFYRTRIKENYGIDVLIPDENERKTIHRIIYRELVKGILSDDSRQFMLDVMGKLSRKGAEGIILGCTEIPLLIQQDHSSLPLFNTMEIHARAALDWALSEE